MKRYLRIFLVLAALSLAVSPVHAKGKEGTSPGKKHMSAPKKPKKIKMALSVLPAAPVDLAASKGAIDGMIGGNKTEVRVIVRAPLPAPSLGILDVASAQIAEIRMEIERNGTVINDCKLASLAKLDDAASATVNFRLHAKNRGKKFVKGECVNGVPLLASSDKVLVYGLVNAARVDFLGSPAALLPAPTPTPTPIQ